MHAGGNQLITPPYSTRPLSLEQALYVYHGLAHRLPAGALDDASKSAVAVFVLARLARRIHEKHPGRQGRWGQMNTRTAAGLVHATLSNMSLDSAAGGHRNQGARRGRARGRTRVRRLAEGC